MVHCVGNNGFFSHSSYKFDLFCGYTALDWQLSAFGAGNIAFRVFLALMVSDKQFCYSDVSALMSWHFPLQH